MYARREYRRIVLAVALAVVTAVPGSAQSLLIRTPVMSVPGRGTEVFLDDQIVRAAAAAESAYEGLTVGYRGFRASLPAERPTIHIDVVAADVEGASMLVLNATGSGGRTESLVYRMPWHDALYRELAAMIGFFGSVLGEATETDDSPVVFFQDFQVEFVASGDLPAGSVLQPYSLTDRNGNLLIASGNFILETDRFFREQTKIGTSADVPGFWAMHVGATPAGTIATASAMQGGIVRLVPGIRQPFRLPTRNSVLKLAIATDGTIFTLDLQQNFMRFGSDRAGPLDLGLPEGTYISFMATGPENTLMLWEPSQRSILIYDPQGVRIGMIVPHVPFDVALSLRYFQPYADGDVLAVFSDRIARLSRTGALRWELLVADVPEIGGLGSFTEFHLDPNDGTVYLLSIQQKRIVQLIDLQALTVGRGLTPAERAILSSNAALRRNPYDQRALAARATVYEELGAWEAAAYTWETAYGINPADPAVASARTAVALRRLEENANRLYEQTVALLEQYGVASAAYAYQQTQAEFEKLISRDPDNDRARGRLSELRRRYEETADPARRPPPVAIENIAMIDLFPSLFATYQREPIGSVTVRNTGSETVRGVRVATEMRFLDFVTPGGSIDSLEPGATTMLPLMLPISVETLRLQESTPVAVGVTVSYETEGRTVQVSEVRVITVHRATALTWDDSAKLAAYITPRDSVVEEFVAPFIGVGAAGRYDVSQSLFRAARISDAVGATGLEYIEDPFSGITDVLGDPFVIDTVRFPRTTLRVGYGDCDDTTALLCSLYESVGISTAIMTSPGHVFMAFDTGEPEQNAWLFESEETTSIAYAGTVWLPYETTTMDQGFLASWREGSRLYRSHAASGEIEFIPVGEQRDRFPALPLDPASFTVSPPPDTLVAPRYDASVTALRETLYSRTIARLAAESGYRGTRGRVRALNQAGVLHARFDERRLALQAFEQAIEIDGEYTASYLNMASLSILEGRPHDAIRWLDEAELRRPGGVVVTLLRAQAEYLSGNRAAAAEQMTLLQTQAPDLAARYGYLSGGDSTGRATEAGAAPALPWAVDE